MAAEAIGPGPSITEELLDKLRPIAFEEALVKFAEGAQLEACIDRILKVLEPSHLATGTPDGPLLCVDVLRLWASGAVHRAKAAAQYPPGERKGKPAAQVRDEWMREHWGKTDAQLRDGSSDHPPSVCPPAGTEWVQLLELIWSTDLKNAYGNVYRSAQLRGTRHLTPWPLEHAMATGVSAWQTLPHLVVSPSHEGRRARIQAHDDDLLHWVGVDYH